MAIRIPPKFGCKVNGDDYDRRPKGKLFDRLNAELKEHKRVEQFLPEELRHLYRNYCFIYIGHSVGEGYGSYSVDRDSDYDRIGEILKTI